MKKYVFALFALMLLAGNSCQEKIDIEKEKAAIIVVIEEETNAYLARDYDRLAATYVQDETNIDLRSGKSGYGIGVGWEEIGSAFKEAIENSPEPDGSKEVKTNYKVKVYPESAWAVFDNEGYNSEGELTNKSIHVEFLEKVDGEWKIVYFSMVSTSTWEDEGENDAEEIDEGEEETETETEDIE